MIDSLRVVKHFKVRGKRENVVVSELDKDMESICPLFFSLSVLLLGGQRSMKTKLGDTQSLFL